MANSQGDGKRKVRRRISRSEWDDKELHKSRGKERVTPELNASEARRRRIERLERSTSPPRRPAATPKMTSESYATLPSQNSSSSHRRRKEHRRSPEERSHRRRRHSSSREDSPSPYVYGTPSSKSQPSRITLSEVKRLGSEYDSTESEDEAPIRSENMQERPRKRKIKIVYITEEDYQSTKHKERTRKREKPPRESTREDGSPRKPKAHRSRRKSVAETPPVSPPRSAPIRDPSSEAPTSLRRSNTTSSTVPSVKPYAPSLTTTTTNTTSKRSSFLGSFFGPSVQQHHEPERLVECLTCLSDDIPRSKSAKLKCGHRMCHSCLRRIFKLSVTDPQHMPPKCCTADHIPLKHVERLFDINFKKLWNRKFQEYSTKNRIYCPARRCGEWIKPGNIHKEDGKKYGKCGRCKTKVCCQCNGKWHGAKDCPKDEETNKLLETAKEAGWQRCYNCRTMVELKEGCNHMTCRCTAEFCMICGLKWKSCNCPWFNYDAVEADRLNHMQIPEPVHDHEVPQGPGRLHRPRRPRPNTYHEEINQRRAQERLDEEMARRLQTISIGDDDDYQGGIGDIHGIGNGAGHFMNQDYIRAAHNILTGTFDQATAAANYVMGVAQARGGPPPPPPGPRRMVERYPLPSPPLPPPAPLARPVSPPPMLRRHTMRERAYNTSPSTRPSERVVPRRMRTDYESEAAVHAPLPRAPEVPTSRSPAVRSPTFPRAPRPSVLAGLGGAGRGSNRVNAWRTHVEPGVTPEEGVLSILHLAPRLSQQPSGENRPESFISIMLLLYQTGSVKIGEVVRYTVTYTPAHDRILPSPPHLHLRVKNTSAIALRAAFVHGPYTLYTAAYPSNFHPDAKFENPRTYGVPEFEPNLKAGGTFTTTLNVPENIRQTAGTADRHGKSPGREGQDVQSVSWVIEVASQVIFSTSAAVHYEILLGRDEKSLSFGFASSLTGSGTPSPVPGQVSDHQRSQGAKDGHHNAQPKGIYSKAIRLRVDDTASLWNTPRMPEWDDAGMERGREKGRDTPVESIMEGIPFKQDGHREKRQKKVHLVVLTHGLHSNLGADMLYMKESIDATAKQAEIDAKARRAKRRKAANVNESYEENHSDEWKNDDRNTKHPTQEREDNLDEEEDDDEEVIVRGFSGNATRTERGIKYLGKRLARYVLAMTYPDQPYRPISKKSTTEAISHALRPTNTSTADSNGPSTHDHSTIRKDPYADQNLPYRITSISFIGHSLGGLIQTYAVAYIQKHSPQFFDTIKPINFIALASPFLGLSNENPLYVKAALDFGLVGRTGQDLGLTWRAPTIARSGWGAIVSGIGETAQKKIDGETPPETKPLLRILPTGPAHVVLKKFRNRTVYSNVVNDGIVPLRTSCLLFLDWQGLGRVEKARRENGLVGTVAGWGWAELTGQNTVSPMARTFSEGYGSDPDTGGENTPTRQGHGNDVPQPPPSATEDDNRSLRSLTRAGGPSLSRRSSVESDSGPSKTQNINNEGPFASLIKFFQPNTSPKSQNHSPKHSKVYKRSQTLPLNSPDTLPSASDNVSSHKKHHRKATNGDSDHEDFDKLSAPPKTTFFEAAGDLLKPPVPSVEFLINPESRARTIFHDRVYHPADIPPPPLKKRPTGSLLSRHRSSSGLTSAESVTPTVPHAESNLSTRDYDDTKNTNPDKDPRDVVDGSAMKVEEKIARAYHRDLSWRKVLVRLEPDAHNNIIVRRMFANAYGWPVVKHLCDTHFSDAAVANTRDEDESGQERAKEENEAPDRDGGETKDINEPIQMLKRSDRTDSEVREATDEVPALHPNPKPGMMGKALSKAMVYERAGNESEGWSERDWADSAEDSDFDEPQSPQAKKGSSGEGKRERGWNWTEAIAGRGATSPKGTDRRSVDSFLGKGKERKPAGPSTQLEGDVAGDRVLSGGVQGMGVGIGQLSPVSPTAHGFSRKSSKARPEN